MSKRMIIRNCPAYSGTQGVYWTCYEDNNKLLCQDCTDCVMKQIVERCKNMQFLSTKNRHDLYAVKVFANDLLQLLDIQEVEYE